MVGKSDIVAGLAWTSVSTVGRRILALLANIILARLLTPADFGLVAMAAVVLGLVDIFKDLGTGAALIQREQVSDALLSSVFWFNVVFGVLTTLAAVACAPFIALAYNEPRVAPVVAGMALSFLLSSMAIVQNSMLQREMQFATLTRIEVTAASVSYAVGIGAALLGHGVWSLVYVVLTNSALFLVLVWIASRWRPGLQCSWAELRQVMRYSLNLACFNVFFYLAQNVDNLLIGRYLGSEPLGWYDLAYRLMTFPLQAISAVFGKVMLPYYARVQDNLPQFRRAFLRVSGAIAFITFPLMLGLLALREPFVLTVFGPQWTPVIALLALFAPLAALRSVQTTTGSIYMATGRTDLQLRWGVLSNFVSMAATVIGLQWGVVGVAAGYTIASLLMAFISFSVPLELIGMRVGELAYSLRTTALCSALMLGVLYLAQGPLTGHVGQTAALWLQTALGVLAYAGFTCLFNRPLLLDLLQLAGLRKPAP